MSDEQKQELATPSNDATNDIESLKAQIEQLESTKNRLLDESNKYKTRKSEVEELRSQLDAYKKTELEKKGEWQKRLEMEREERLNLEQTLEAQKKRILQSNVFNEVANYAKDAYDINDLLAQKEFANMIEVDEETLEPVKETIHSFVDSLKEKKKYLFKGHKVASMADSKPSIDKPTPKTFNQMSDKEKAEALKASLSQLSHDR